MRTQIIEIQQGDDGNLSLKSHGNLNASQVYVALSMECDRLLDVLRQRPFAIPNPAQGLRIPADVARRLLNAR